MTHTIEIKENGQTVASYQGLSKKEAIIIAKKESSPDNQVFVIGYNGQCGVYLNPNGNYEITGKSW